MTWKQIYEEQIERMNGLSDSSKIALLESSLRACAEAFDRMEASKTKLIATIGEGK